MKTGIAVSLLATLGLTVAASAAIAADADEKAAICAKAQERLAAAEGLPPLEPGMATVLMYKYTFCPQTLKVQKGTTIRFINVDKRTSHSAWFKEAGIEESERLFPEEVWDIRLDIPGVYPYLCGPHWEQEKMIGAIEVTE